MKDFIRNHPITESIRYMVHWTVFALVTGAVGGFLGGIFSRCIHVVTAFRSAHSWGIFLLPAAGVVIVFLYHITGEEKNRGVNMVLASISARDKVTMATGPLIFASTILSHLGGASVGREGATLQLGGWLGSRFGELIHLDEKDERTAIMCGMSAVFAAMFGTPVAAAVFCIEVISVGVFYYSSLIPCVFSAFIGASVGKLMGAEEESWRILSVPDFSIKLLLQSVLLGILCAILAIIMIVAIHSSEKYAKRFLPNPYVRVLVTSGIFIALTLLLHTTKYTGAGGVLIDEAMKENVDPPAFFLKLIFTCICIAGGFRGGEIVPTLSIGASFGALFSSLTGFPVSLGAACGMIALFSAATNCPIASLLIAMEMFRGDGLPYFTVTVALAFVLSGYYGLYGTQRFIYSKTKNEYIDRMSN